MKKEDRRAVEREVEIMRRLQHPRLIQLYDAIDCGKQFYVILELIEGGELFERVIDDDFLLTERSCAVFMRQICEGIEFVHAQNILHLDMKPENILCLTKEGNRVKIIDFGLARQFDPRKKLQVLFGTPEFVAPEVVNFDQIGFGTDMWSIGVICYVLLSGLSPFMGDTDVETMANVTIAKYDFDHEAFANISDDAKDFIRSLLIKDREKRMTASQCRSHGWLACRNSKITSTKKKKKKLENGKISQDPNSHAKKSMDVAKDNLRIFVERWREHPNSPYNLENDSEQLDSIHNAKSTSLCAESPSPHGSICSNSSEWSETFENNQDKMLHAATNVTMERRASEGNSKDTQIHDQVSQIELAEEIIKLSEHLRTMASSSQRPPNSIRIKSSQHNLGDRSNENNVGNVTSPVGKSEGGKIEKIDMETAGQIASNDQSECNRNEVNEICDKISKITQQRRLNGTTFNGNKNYDKQQCTSSPFTLKKSCDANQIHSLPDGDTQNEKKLEKLWQLKSQQKFLVNDNICKEIDLTPPWRKARTKRRFSETCRDVPRISNLQDIHKSMSLDEPANTKNLLLKLLEEWDERPGSQIFGRKSISVDWNAESVARRSMNSLAEYFQSERQKPPKSTLPHTSTTT
ncbi:hypothetical protein PV327_006621 [Microctonus hyperodae]|nr:hypothetical protein PV327_006621 [Microctonus hyperodae]